MWDLEHSPEDARGGAVSVGNFDGVHRGHAAMLARLAVMSRRIAGPTVAITFDPHPAAFLRASQEPPRLTEIERRAELLNLCGVDFVVVCKTSVQWLQQTAEEFFDSVLIRSVGAKGIVEGPNFYFGKNREGDTRKLGELCKLHGIELEIVEPESFGSGMVSSTEVRRRLQTGDVAGANRLLLESYRIRGTVVHGESRGRQIGFPTANLANIRTLVPGPGVYATRTKIGSRSFASATHIGPSPTFDSNAVCKVETHVLDLEDDLYDQVLEIEMLERIRDVQRFGSVSELKEQLVRDVQAARQIVGYP